MEYKMNLHPGPFESVKSGRKTVEMRLNDEKRRLFRIGDFIIFVNSETGEEIKSEIMSLDTHPDFYSLYRNYGKTEIGYLDDEEANPADMYEYYEKEKIEKHGVLAIRIRLTEKQ